MFSSVTAKISLFMSIVLIAIFSIAGTTVYYFADKMMKKDSEAIVNALAELSATKIKEATDHYMMPALQITAMMEKRAEAVEKDRAKLDKDLIDVLSKNKQVLDTWALFEPNAYDGQDSKYVNSPMSDKTGRYLAAWNWINGKIEFAVAVDYDKPGVGDYYLIPKADHKPHVVEPYLYPVDGKQVLMTSFCFPIMQGDKFLGVAGVDVLLSDLGKMVSEYKPLDEGYITIVSEKGTVIADKNPELLGKAIAGYSPAIAKTILNNGNNSQVITITESLHGQEEMRHVITPVKIRNTQNIWYVIATIPESAFMANQIFLIKVIVIIFAISIFFALYARGAITKTLVGRPLKSLYASLQQLAAGNHNAEVKETHRQDEVGGIARAVLEFRDGLRANSEKIATEEIQRKEQIEAERKKLLLGLAQEFENSVRGQVQDLAKYAKSMQEGVNDVTKIATETERYSERVLSSSTQAAENSNLIASTAGELTNSIREISSQTQKSSQIANEAAGKAKTARQAIDLLSSRSDRVGEIIGVITKIAGQINLLALNATIESASAGAAGRGFAVVANEVKNLANQVSKATEEITRQIHEIQQATNQSVQSVEEILSIVGVVTDTTTAVAAAVEEQLSATGSIADSIHQTSSQTKEISATMTNVEDGAKKTGQTSRDVYQHSETLRKTVESLQHSVDDFINRVKQA